MDKRGSLKTRGSYLGKRPSSSDIWGFWDMKLFRSDPQIHIYAIFIIVFYLHFRNIKLSQDLLCYPFGFVNLSSPLVLWNYWIRIFFFFSRFLTMNLKNCTKRPAWWSICTKKFSLTLTDWAGDDKMSMLWMCHQGSLLLLSLI